MPAESMCASSTAIPAPMPPTKGSGSSRSPKQWRTASLLSVRHPNGRISSEIGWEGRAALVDVFVSYKQEERDAGQIIASSLADLKLDAWFNTKLRPAGSFAAE